MTGTAGDPNGEFDSAWLKWGRATAHAQQLHSDIEAAQDLDLDESQPVLAAQFDPQRGGISLVVDNPPPLPVIWKLQLGDVAGNFRASLDHLAWALVQRGDSATLNDEEARRVGYPICFSESNLARTEQRMLPGVRPADLAIIRRHQPYSDGIDLVRWHTLTILRNMVNADKHRNLHGLWHVVDRHQLNVVKAHDCTLGPVPAKGQRVLMEKGAELAFIPVTWAGDEPHVHMEHQLSTRPAFTERLWLQHWMQIAIAYGGRLLGRFAEAPEEEMATLGIADETLGAALARQATAEAAWAEAASTGKLPSVTEF